MVGKLRVVFATACTLLLATGALAQPAPATASKPSTAATQPGSASPPNAALRTVAAVDSTNGRVMINRATSYTTATKDERLQVGDRLVVLEGGSVRIRFDSGCLQTIDTTSVYTVPAVAPCVPGSAERGLRLPTPVPSTTAASTTTAASSGTFLKWGLVALGVATPFLVLTNSTQGSPISP